MVDHGFGFKALSPEGVEGDVHPFVDHGFDGWIFRKIVVDRDKFRFDLGFTGLRIEIEIDHVNRAHVGVAFQQRGKIAAPVLIIDMFVTTEQQADLRKFLQQLDIIVDGLMRQGDHKIDLAAELFDLLSGGCNRIGITHVTRIIGRQRQSEHADSESFSAFFIGDRNHQILFDAGIRLTVGGEYVAGYPGEFRFLHALVELTLLDVEFVIAECGVVQLQVI